MKKTLRIGVALLGAGLGLGLAGCGTSAPTTPVSSDYTVGAEPVTISLYWWGGDARVQRTQQVISAFEQKFPNITVDPQYVDWSGYWDKLATATAGNNSPDVIQMDEMYLASYSARNTLVDLATLPELDTSAYDPSVLGMGQWSGKQYAIPISTTSFGILVNTDVLKQLGLTLPDTSTWSWDQYQAFAKSVTNASNGSVVGTGVMNNGYSLQLFARQKGDQLFADGDIVIKPATLAAYFQLASDLSTSGAAPSASHLAETASLAIGQDDFSTGKLAMLFSQTTQITAYAQASGANIQIVPLPSFDANATKYQYFKMGMYWSVSAQSKHPQEAAALINFMVNDPTAAAMLGTERGIPANPQMLTAISSTLTQNEQQAVTYTNSLIPQLGPAPTITPNGASDLDNIIARYEQQVLAGQQSPTDAATAMIAEIHQDIQQAQ